MLKRWVTGLILCLLLGTGIVSAQDDGSTLDAWADTPASAFNLTQQVVWPTYARPVGAISTYTATGDPTLSCAPAGHSYSVWATFVASQTGTLMIGATPSNYDAVVAVFKTTPTTPFRCANTFGATADAEVVTFKMVAGTRYYVMFAANGAGATIDSSSSISFVVIGNALLGNAIQIPASGSYSIIQSEIDNVPSGGMNFQTCGTVTHVVYYTFKPRVSGRYEFSTANSTYDTTMIVVDDGDILACSRDLNASNATSRLRPTLSAGVTYIIGIGQDTAAVNPQTDDMVLSLRVRKL